RGMARVAWTSPTESIFAPTPESPHRAESVAPVRPKFFRSRFEDPLRVCHRAPRRARELAPDHPPETQTSDASADDQRVGLRPEGPAVARFVHPRAAAARAPRRAHFGHREAGAVRPIEELVLEDAAGAAAQAHPHARWAGAGEHLGVEHVRIPLAPAR